MNVRNDWQPIEELKITPEMENWELLLYVEQRKLCRLQNPRVITADIIDGKIQICHTHGYENNEINPLGKITHYVWLESPYEND